MKIETTRFGLIDIDEKKIIHMPYGIPGFPERKDFVILRHKEDSPFYWYQSVDEPSLAFVITNPYIFFPDYNIDLNGIIKEMKWDSINRENIEVYVIVNIPKGRPKDMTVNLMGPLIINTEKREAIQAILVNTPYSHRHPVFKDSKD